MRRRAANVPLEANRVARKVALAVDQTLVMGTPVDTGRARSSWIVALGEASDAVVEPYAPLPPGTDPGKFSETANAQAAMDQGQQAIGQKKPEQPVHITNNVEYIRPLNEGHSAQAPAMFVEAAIAEGVAAVKNERIDTGRGI